MPTLWVAIAGAAGAVLRYRIGLAVGVRAFPWATLSINVIGTFALALIVAGPLAQRWGPTATAAIGAGLLGGFTTFSTFGYETITLIRDQRLGAAGAYVIASIVLGLGSAAIGYLIGRSL